MPCGRVLTKPLRKIISWEWSCSPSAQVDECDSWSWASCILRRAAHRTGRPRRGSAGSVQGSPSTYRGSSALPLTRNRHHFPLDPAPLNFTRLNFSLVPVTRVLRWEIRSLPLCSYSARMMRDWSFNLLQPDSLPWCRPHTWDALFFSLPLPPCFNRPLPTLFSSSTYRCRFSHPSRPLSSA